MRKLLVLAAAAAALVLPASGSAGGSTAFSDPTGDTPGADITAVGVSNDDNGVVTFSISIPNRPALGSNMAVVMFLDTDQNATTGDPKVEGADYVLEYDSGRPTLGKWNGADWDLTVPQTSLNSSYASGLTLKISTADLGGTTGFSFVSAADEHAADGTPQFDFAPDLGMPAWSYTVQITPPPAKPPVTPKPTPTPKPKPKKKKKH